MNLEIQLAEKTYSKAQAIAVNKRIHKSSAGNIWMVEGSKPGSFYKLQYIEGELICECPAYVYGATNPCKHAIAVSLQEVSK